ncbi:hypothetical protein [Streptomyces griseus]|uniref:hypothetical protein n=1 Tax=Streptomyces griseus TaxID=1911 RepID=UPI00083FFE50
MTFGQNSAVGPRRSSSLGFFAQVWLGEHLLTVTRAIAEVRTLLAERVCAVPDRPGLRLRTLTDVCAYAQSEGVEPRVGAPRSRFILRTARAGHRSG